MATIDVLIGLVVIGAFFLLIGSKVYKHEKEQIDPIIEKIKGWFSKEEDSSDTDKSENNPWDHELEFRGKTK